MFTNASFSFKWQGCAIPFILLLSCLSGSAAVLNVGPGQKYLLPCKALLAAKSGDTIQIDAAGNYTGDVCRWTMNNLTLIGINGRPHIDAAGKSAVSKGIWVIDGSDTTVENIEFSGAVSSSGNGAGIRQDGPGLTVRNCYFHNNQDGLFSTATSGSLLVEYSEFAYNGSGSGHTHNIYVGHIDSFTLRYSYSHHSNVGHLVKSRAAVSYIYSNRMTDEATGNGSYEMDFPNGGTSYVIGNLLEQGPKTVNSSILAYGEEGPASPALSQDLYVVNNTFVNDYSSGMFVNIYSGVITPAVITDNIFSGPGTLTNQTSAVLTSNLIGVNPEFVDKANYDYRLLSGSPAIGAAVNPGSSSEGISLSATSQYVHAACSQSRDDTNDLGALEGGLMPVNMQCSSADVALSNVTAMMVLSPTSAIGGSSTIATVTLNQPASADGIQFAFTSSSTAVPVPTSITVPAGLTSASLQVATNPVTSATSAMLIVYTAGTHATATLTITP